MELYISVRELVEFMLRCGDIDHSRVTSAEDRMQEGARIHRMLQRQKGSDYRSEVTLRYTHITRDYEILLEGRADGIMGEHSGAECITIDEIKSTRRDLDKIKEPVPVHLAQAKCYAYMYALEHGKAAMQVQMTYFHVETEQLKYFQVTYPYEELEKWFLELLLGYQKWTDYQYQWRQIRKSSIQNIPFPFPYRAGQKELVSYVYQTIYHKRKLFIEAPTGVGKTISTVFPAVKAVGEDLAEKIFYLTAKTITRTVAKEAFGLLREKGLCFKTVVLTAKEKICFTGETECNPVACPYAKGHYDRINDALYDMLTHEVDFGRECIESYAQKHRVCPFEMCLDISLFSDGIICDYNYVFDPHVYLRRFFAEGNKGNYLFLVDEAHNLLDRGRDMYSAVLIKEDFLACKKAVKLYDKKLEVALEKCNRVLLQYKKSCETYEIHPTIESFILALNRLSARMEVFLENHDDSPIRQEVLEFYFKVSHFLLIYDSLDDSYVIYSEMLENGDFMMKLFCVNPATGLQECMQRSVSTILFSATLLPIQYYKRLLGGDEQDYEVYADSVFNPTNRGLFIGRDVTSRYAKRGPDQYGKIAQYIKQIILQKAGNYMIFFPSYFFMRQVLEQYQAVFWDRELEECLVQEEYMREEQRESFLDRFLQNTEDSSNYDTPRKNPPKSLLGFCVMGGIFGEGIDLKQDSLIGVLIVGTGFPQVCNEREIMKNYFDRESGNGFDYAYQYPGMNKVLQAAGRVIRTSEDVGIVALLDERFVQKGYQRMFPREWKDIHVVTVEDVAGQVRGFWNKSPLEGT